jgi:hypothetical protein
MGSRATAGFEAHSALAASSDDGKATKRPRACCSDGDVSRSPTRREGASTHEIPQLLFGLRVAVDHPLAASDVGCKRGTRIVGRGIGRSASLALELDKG